MDVTSLVFLLVSLLLSLLCCGGGLLFFLLVLGFIVMRRRGKKKITAKAAMSAGVESVSQVFVRGKGGLTPEDDEDDD